MPTNQNTISGLLTALLKAPLKVYVILRQNQVGYLIIIDWRNFVSWHDQMTPWYLASVTFTHHRSHIQLGKVEQGGERSGGLPQTPGGQKAGEGERAPGWERRSPMPGIPDAPSFWGWCRWMCGTATIVCECQHFIHADKDWGLIFQECRFAFRKSQSKMGVLTLWRALECGCKGSALHISAFAVLFTVARLQLQQLCQLKSRDFGPHLIWMLRTFQNSQQRDNCVRLLMLKGEIGGWWREREQLPGYECLLSSLKRPLITDQTHTLLVFRREKDLLHRLEWRQQLWPSSSSSPWSRPPWPPPRTRRTCSGAPQTSSSAASRRLKVGVWWLQRFNDLLSCAVLQLNLKWIKTRACCCIAHFAPHQLCLP